MAENLFFEYLKAITKKEKSFEEYFVYFRKIDNFKQFDSYMMNRYLYNGNMAQYANIFNKYLSTLSKEEMFRFMYFGTPVNKNFITYVKKIKKPKLEIIYFIKDFYTISYEKAEEYLYFLNDIDLDNLLNMYGKDEEEKRRILCTLDMQKLEM